MGRKDREKLTGLKAEVPSHPVIDSQSVDLDGIAIIVYKSSLPGDIQKRTDLLTGENSSFWRKIGQYRTSIVFTPSPIWRWEQPRKKSVQWRMNLCNSICDNVRLTCSVQLMPTAGDKISFSTKAPKRKGMDQERQPRGRWNRKEATRSSGPVHGVRSEAEL